MPRLIVIGGSPGCGKSTLASQLRALLKAPWIDFGRLREFHLERDWSNQSPQEEAMAFENLIAMLHNYFRHGYSNVIVDDLQDHRILQMSDALPEVPVQILTLVISNADELRERIHNRDDGWKDAEAAVKWNQRVIDRDAVDFEHKIDVAAKSRAQVIEEALEVLGITRP